MLPNFECSMNIWDPKYSNCNVPENIMSNYTVNIAIHTPTYMREQAEFMYRLKMFIKNCNKGTFKQPMLGKREVDLYRLFREVTAHGGCENVIKKEGTWSRIYRGMDNYSPTETSASYRLKKMYIPLLSLISSYNKYLIDFEKEIFNFRCPSSHSDYSFSRQTDKTLQPSMNLTPIHSPTVGAYPQSPQVSQKSYPYMQYTQYPQWQPKLQQPPVSVSTKRYAPYSSMQQPSLSPPVQTMSPIYSYSPVMSTYPNSMPFIPMQSQKNYYDVYSIPVTPHGYEGFEGEKRFRSVTPREVGSTDIFSNRWNLPNPQCLKLPSYLDLPKPLLYLSRMKDITLFWLCVAVFRQHRQTVLGNSFGDC